MIEKPGTWADLQVDSYLRDREGTDWRVCAEDRGWFRCKNRAGEWVTLSPKPPETPVTLLVVDDAADLIALLRDGLGAEVIARKLNDEQVWLCAPWPETYKGALAQFRNHLNLTHGMYSNDVRTFKALVEAHQAAHDPDEPYVGKGVLHTHRRTA